MSYGHARLALLNFRHSRFLHSGLVCVPVQKHSREYMVDTGGEGWGGGHLVHNGSNNLSQSLLGVLFHFPVVSRERSYCMLMDFFAANVFQI